MIPLSSLNLRIFWKLLPYVFFPGCAIGIVEFTVAALGNSGSNILGEAGTSFFAQFVWLVVSSILVILLTYRFASAVTRFWIVPASALMLAFFAHAASGLGLLFPGHNQYLPDSFKTYLYNGILRMSYYFALSLVGILVWVLRVQFDVLKQKDLPERHERAATVKKALNLGQKGYFDKGRSD